MSFKNLLEINFLVVLVFGVLADQAPADLGLRKLENKLNFIKVTYKDETQYPNGFGNEHRQGIDHIEYENESYLVNKTLTIEANKSIEIYFSEPVKSLSNFFRDIAAYNKGDASSKNIISVDFTNFDSSKLEEANCMFYGCSSIEEINFDNFATSGKIKDMSYMFYDCTNIKAIDLSQLVSSSVENTKFMFANCKSLKFLDISNFDLATTADVDEMFNSLDKLEYINIYNAKANEPFKTALSKLNRKEGLMACQREEIISGVISKCCSLFREIETCAQTNYIIAKFNKDVFYPYGFGFIEYDKSPNEYRNEIYLIRNAKKVYGPDEALDIPANEEVEIYFNTTLVNLTKFFFYYDDPNLEYLQSLNFAFFNSSLIESMDSAFYGCISLESLYLTNFEAPLLTNMNNAFFHCSSLKFIDLSYIISSSITSMNRIFCGCKSLQTLVLKNLDMTNVEDAFYAFYNVQNLKYLDLTNIKMNDVFKNELLGQYGLNEANNTIVCQDKKIITNLNYQYNCYNLDYDYRFECSNNILVYYKNESNYEKSFITGTEGEEIASRKSIKYIYINDDIYEVNSPLSIKDNSYVKLCFENPASSLENMFNGEKDSNVVNIKSIDLSHFDSSLLNNMNYSFSGCSELIALNLSNINFEKLNSAYDLFKSVTNLKYFVFKNTNLNEKSFGLLFTDELNNNPNLIPCHNNEYLQNLVPSICCVFDIELGRCQRTNNYITVTYSYDLLSMNEGFEYLDGFANNNTQRESISFINYKNLTYRVNSLLTLDVTKEEEDQILELHFLEPITNLSNFFSWYNIWGEEEEIDIGGLQPIVFITDGMDPIYSVDFSNFDSSLIEDASSMFENAIFIQKINFTNFNTSIIKNMENMFKGCVSLSSLDLSNFNTSSVTSMSSMFEGCRYLKSLLICLILIHHLLLLCQKCFLFALI